MTKVCDVSEYLESIAPREMKMDFDNIGLLVGRSCEAVEKIIVSLDITSAVIDEAVEWGAKLIVSHHPLFFSLKSVTDGDIIGKKIVKLLSNGISAICMHTNLDAAQAGVNDVLATAAGISEDTIALLSNDGVLPSGDAFSYGRIGNLVTCTNLQTYLKGLKDALSANGLRYYDASKPVFKVAVVGGSGGSELKHAVKNGCDTFVTSDIKYDVFLDAMEQGINLIDAGHFCTENLVIAPLAERMQRKFPSLSVEVSKKHSQIIEFS